MTDELVRERHGNVLVARLNRPEARNALNRALLVAVSQVVLDAESDPDIRCLVLTGTGNRAFCAGLDLRDVAEGGMGSFGADDTFAGFFKLVNGEARVPIVGAANATAVAGGLELLLGCDLIVASADARFGLPEVKRGLFPGGGGTFIGLRVPLGIALELTLTGETIDAERAFGVGLVNAVAPPAEVLPTALALAEKIAANGPLGVAACKELVHLAVTDHARAKERLGELQPAVFGSDDAREGATAFIEKREPRWQGR